jgi:hypothetical protein
LPTNAGVLIASGRRSLVEKRAGQSLSEFLVRLRHTIAGRVASVTNKLWPAPRRGTGQCRVVV